MNTPQNQAGLSLVLPSPCHREEYAAMMREWEDHGGRINPGAVRRRPGVDYDTWLAHSIADRNATICPPGQTPQTLYFLTSDSVRILGALSIRHYLGLEMPGVNGHLGFGVRPSERRKGYASAMVRMAMPLAREIGITQRFILSCDQDNDASAQVIRGCGGRFIDLIVEQNRNIIHRYIVLLTE